MPTRGVIASALKTLRAISAAYPDITPLMSAKARYIVGIGAPDMAIKDAEAITRRMEYLIQAVYNGTIGGGFIDAMAALVSRQMTLAVNHAWQDEGSGTDGEPMPDYLTQLADDAALSQFDYVDGLYRDIVDAKVDGAGAEQFGNRIDMWSHQYDVTYKDAVDKIHFETGGNFTWRKGNTEHGCDTCANLDGITLSAKDWEELGIHPRGYPNPLLDCQGGGPAGYCDCEFVATDQRRSPKGYTDAMDIVSK